MKFVDFVRGLMRENYYWKIIEVNRSSLKFNDDTKL